VAQNKVTEFTVSPTQPLVTTCVSSYGCTDQFSGLIKPGVTQEKSFIGSVGDYLFSKDGASLLVSLPPFVGEAYDVATLIAGKDPITGEALSTLMRFATVGGLLSGVGSGKAAREAMHITIKKLSDTYGLSIAEVEKIADDIVRNIDLDDIDVSLFAKVKGELEVGVKAAKIAKLSAIASKIANGHAYDKHIHEFVELGITTKDGFSKHIENILNNPTEVRALPEGRTAYYHKESQTVIVVNSTQPDGGTALIPTDPITGVPDALNYFTNVLK
jgi:hypothetical protein